MIEIIEQKAMELARKHAEILEEECKKVCEQYDVGPANLIIEYHADTSIKIKIQASHFKVTNTFVYDDGIIRNETNG